MIDALICVRWCTLHSVALKRIYKEDVGEFAWPHSAAAGLCSIVQDNQAEDWRREGLVENEGKNAGRVCKDGFVELVYETDFAV